MLLYYIYPQIPEIIEENVITWVSQTFREFKYLNMDQLFFKYKIGYNPMHGHQNVFSVYLWVVKSRVHFPMFSHRNMLLLWLYYLK